MAYRVHPAGRRRRHLAAAAFTCVALTATLACSSRRESAQQRSFAAPEDAARALIEALKKDNNPNDVLALFGPDAKELIDSSDPVAARRNREVFTVAAAEKWRLVDQPRGGKTLVIGNEDWPFAVPIVMDENGWHFDTAAGKEEVIARRIGRNELAAIRAAETYVAAQRIYAQRAHDGRKAGLYATAFRSDPGKHNGLYWPVEKGQKRSPLGDLMAGAAETHQGTTEKPAPFHGYYFKILTGQGSGAPGGEKTYMVKGLMSGGFALVAWPYQYDMTGVMTFIVNQDGIVYEKDLGPETDATAKAIAAYNPDGSWQRVQ